MKRMISADRLARPDHFITMTVENLRGIRAEQGLTGVIAVLDDGALRARLHTVYTGELQAMEVPDVRSLIFQTRLGSFSWIVARQVWDELPDTEIFERLLDYLGAKPGDYVETDLLWRCTQNDDSAARVAGINRTLAPTMSIPKSTAVSSQARAALMIKPPELDLRRVRFSLR